MRGQQVKTMKTPKANRYICIAVLLVIVALVAAVILVWVNQPKNYLGIPLRITHPVSVNENSVVEYHFSESKGVKMVDGEIAIEHNILCDAELLTTRDSVALYRENATGKLFLVNLESEELPKEVTGSFVGTLPVVELDDGTKAVVTWDGIQVIK